MYRTKRRDGEDASMHLDKKRGQAESFVSGTWLLVLASSTAFLCLCGFVLHSRVSKSREVQLVQGKLPEAMSAAAKAGNHMLPIEEFRQCNAAMPPSELSDTPADAALGGAQCGEAEAASLARALRGAGYAFEASVPKPYIFPGYLQQVLSLLEGPTLAVALKHLQANVKDHKLLTLLKLFAWGLPVPEAELDAALDPGAMDTLLRCRVLAPCSKLQGMTTSLISLFPVPKSDLLVATDWASRSLIGMREEIVPIVDPEGIALTFNSPSPRGLRVLDLDSGSGLHALLAARRGAARATVFARGARADRFVRFSSWLNHLGGTVEIARGASRASAAYVLEPGAADVVMAQPPFAPSATGGQRPDGTQALRDVLAVASKVLALGGQLALISEFASADFATKLCAEFGLPGFMGSLVMRRNPIPAEAYIAAHGDGNEAHAHEAVAKMKAAGIRAVSTGFLFAKRAKKELLDNKGCGSFSLQTLIDPMAWPKPGDSRFMRPCFLSQETDCPESAAH